MHLVDRQPVHADEALTKCVKWAGANVAEDDTESANRQTEVHVAGNRGVWRSRGGTHRKPCRYECPVEHTLSRGSREAFVMSPDERDQAPVDPARIDVIA